MTKNASTLSGAILEAAAPTLPSVNLAIAFVELIRLLTPDGDPLLNHLDEIRSSLFDSYNELVKSDDD